MARDNAGRPHRSRLHVSLETVLDGPGTETTPSAELRRTAPISGDELRVILDTIDRTGSIGIAAGEVGRSYRHTWDVLGRASASYGVSLVETTVGGRTGGGTRLTEDGRDVLRRLREASADLQVIISRRAAPADAPPTVMIASTLEVLDTGLDDLISRRFFAESGIRVGFVGAGSGEALALATQGRLDAVITHAPTLEAEFVRNGWGEQRVPLMEGGFVLVGPADDPAGVRDRQSSAVEVSITAAFGRIAGTGSIFLSRGDNSGTHLKEMELWRSAGLEPEAPWYRRCVGLGNREILQRAAALGGYALVDAATLHAIGIPRGISIVWPPLAGRGRRFRSDEAVTRYTMTTVKPTVLRDNPLAVDRRAEWTRQLTDWLVRSVPTILAEESRGSRGVNLFQPI
jgi:tungstate transport system substrate-binding protein